MNHTVAEHVAGFETLVKSRAADVIAVSEMSALLMHTVAGSSRRRRRCYFEAVNYFELLEQCATRFVGPRVRGRLLLLPQRSKQTHQGSGSRSGPDPALPLPQVRRERHVPALLPRQ